MRTRNRLNCLIACAMAFFPGVSTNSSAQVMVDSRGLPAHVVLRVAPNESDFFVTLVGRIEVAEFRQPGSSTQLLAEEIGLSSEVASRLSSQVLLALERYRENHFAMRKGHCNALLGKPSSKAELTAIMKAAEEQSRIGRLKLFEESLAGVGVGDREKVRSWLASSTQSVISVNRVDFDALERDQTIHVAALIQRMCANRPTASRD